MHLATTLSAQGLEPGGSYAVTIESRSQGGHGTNLGTGDQQASPAGRVVFDLTMELLEAVAHAGQPCEVKVWIRHGGGQVGDPPVAPRYLTTLEVP